MLLDILKFRAYVIKVCECRSTFSFSSSYYYLPLVKLSSRSDMQVYNSKASIHICFVLQHSQFKSCRAI
jgi:hypothetical protein